MKKIYLAIVFLIFLGVFSGNAQQDPQYTQYMYNTQVVNPAYAGNRDVLSFGLLYRTQWVGLEGAPETGTFTIDSPIGSLDNMGLGLTIVRDEIGPSIQTNVTADYSYTINTGESSQLSFGVKAGVDILDVDFSRLNISDPGDVFENNIDNKVSPQIGAGVYFNTNRFYAGLSVPNFLDTDHFDSSDLVDENGQSTQSSTAKDRLHYFFIAGYVFDLGENLKFKPATMFKAVAGSPLQADLSLNFLLFEKLTLGAAYRWDAALSALAGFQFTDQIFIGFGYDFETTDIEKYNGGSYEFMIRFDVFKTKRVLTPRFF
jgi:type IX secretion system PorP/SprF family membrane protein